jgi:hypothetical protein
MARLTGWEARGLLAALEDEHRAWATYDQVIRDFGPIRPFVNIRESEARHINALHGLCRRYGIAIPTNPWIGKAERYASIAAACKAGVDAEIENAALYDRLFASTKRRDILSVYSRLREASEQRHLPAFRRCVSRGCTPSGGARRARRGWKADE